MGDSGLRQVIVAQRRRVFLLPGPWRAGLVWKDQAAEPRLRGQCHRPVRLPLLVPLALLGLLHSNLALGLLPPSSPGTSLGTNFGKVKVEVQ